MILVYAPLTKILKVYTSPGKKKAEPSRENTSPDDEKRDGRNEVVGELDFLLFWVQKGMVPL